MGYNMGIVIYLPVTSSFFHICSPPQVFEKNFLSLISVKLMQFDRVDDADYEYHLGFSVKRFDELQDGIFKIFTYSQNWVLEVFSSVSDYVTMP